VSATSEKIVIIDDEKRMCDSLTVLLEADGYQVRSFQRSPEAVEAIRQERVDLVITDIKMPELGGLDILNVVKEIDEGIPVILMTGYASLDTALDAIGRGAYDYLLKPVEFAYLELAVKRALEKRRGELARLRLLEELKLSNLILQRRVGELNALYEAGKSIGSTANLNDLLRQIVVLAATVTEAQVGSIMLLDENREFLTIEAAIGLDDHIVDGTSLPIGESIAGYVAETGEAIMIEDVEKDARFKRINQERYGSASLLCSPLRIKNNVLGVINMANKQDNKAFTSDDLRLLTTFASQAAIAVDDAYQFEKSRRRLVEFEILHELANELSTVPSINAFHALLVKKLRRVFQIDVSIWFNFDPVSKTLIPDGAVGDTAIPLTESGRINVSRVSRESLQISEVTSDLLAPESIRVLSELLHQRVVDLKYFPSSVSAFMAVPVLRNQEPEYVFCFGASGARNYSDDDISLARLVISQAALLFEREKALLNGTRLLTMGNMISEISHDLRKPLTSISGGLQILKQRWPETLGESEIVSSAEEEISRMNELVGELVDFSNPNKYETSQVDLRQIVHRAGELIGPDLRRHKVALETEFEEAVWEVIVNKNQILEMFLNLFINALDAMPSGGTLRVHGLVERPGHKKVDFLAIRVSDTGLGIKKENLAKIFDRYYTTKDHGTGLGLPVVERIIASHLGTLKVESEDGKGTTFTVYLPLSTLL
jgi:signal transduction histidine kinase/FixJ family two-component response regulator/putative methionine-R-sulfoxide reductase with GAF domain